MKKDIAVIAAIVVAVIVIGIMGLADDVGELAEIIGKFLIKTAEAIGAAAQQIGTGL